MHKFKILRPSSFQNCSNFFKSIKKNWRNWQICKIRFQKVGQFQLFSRNNLVPLWHSKSKQNNCETSKSQLSSTKCKLDLLKPIEDLFEASDNKINDQEALDYVADRNVTKKTTNFSRGFTDIWRNRFF